MATPATAASASSKVKPANGSPQPPRNSQAKTASLSIIAACYLCAASLVAQDYRSSMSSDAALEAHAAQVEGRPYTYKTGDFRLLLAPQFGFDYNDNISVSNGEQKDDFILRPALAIAGTNAFGFRDDLNVGGAS